MMGRAAAFKLGALWALSILEHGSRSAVPRTSGRATMEAEFFHELVTDVIGTIAEAVDKEAISWFPEGD